MKYEAKIVLSAMKPGSFTIPAYNFQVNVSTGNFFSSSKPVYLKTDPLELTVKPLPDPPADFSGVIGKLNLESGYSRLEVNYGDSITLQVTASGDCNLDSLTKIFSSGVNGFSVYETQKSADESVENNQYHARKEFDIILVPESNGEIKIDPVFITYYNPETNTYEKAVIPGTTITVHGEAPAVQGPTQAGTGSVETVRIEQVSYNNNTAGGEYLTIQLKKSSLVTALWISGGILVLGITAFMVLLWSKRRSKALDDFYKKIRKSGDPNEIYNLFNTMVKSVFGVSLKADTRDTVSSRLSAYGLDAQILEIQDLLEGRKSKATLEEAKNKIRQLLKKFRKTTRKVK